MVVVRMDNYLNANRIDENNLNDDKMKTKKQRKRSTFYVEWMRSLELIAYANDDRFFDLWKSTDKKWPTHKDLYHHHNDCLF